VVSEAVRRCASDHSWSRRVQVDNKSVERITVTDGMVSLPSWTRDSLIHGSLKACSQRVSLKDDGPTGQTTGQRGSDPSAYRVSITGYYNIL